MLRNELSPQSATALPPTDISDPSIQLCQRRFVRDRRQRVGRRELEENKKRSVGVETKDAERAGASLGKGSIDGSRSPPKALAATVTSAASKNGTVPLASTQMTLRTVTRPSSTATSRLPEFVPITRTAVDIAATPAVAAPAAQSPSTFLTLVRPSTSQPPPPPASNPTAIPVPAIPASVPQPAIIQPATSVPAPPPAVIQPAQPTTIVQMSTIIQPTTIIQMSTVVQPTTVLQMSTIVQPTTVLQMSTVVQPTTISQAAANVQPTPAVQSAAGPPTIPISQATGVQSQSGAVAQPTLSASGQLNPSQSGFRPQIPTGNVVAALLNPSASAASNEISSVGETGTVPGGVAALIVFGVLGLLGFLFIIVWACRNRHHAKKTEISVSRAGTRTNTPELKQVKH